MLTRRTEKVCAVVDDATTVESARTSNAAERVRWADMDPCSMNGHPSILRWARVRLPGGRFERAQPAFVIPSERSEQAAIVPIKRLDAPHRAGTLRRATRN